MKIRVGSESRQKIGEGNYKTVMRCSVRIKQKLPRYTGRLIKHIVSSLTPGTFWNRDRKFGGLYLVQHHSWKLLGKNTGG